MTFESHSAVRTVRPLQGRGGGGGAVLEGGGPALLAYKGQGEPSSSRLEGDAGK